MLEQMGDVVRQSEPSPVIRWHKHTWKSRLVAIALGVMALGYFAWNLVGRQGQPFGLGFIFMAAFFVGRHLIRKWQVEIIRPRPQTAEHRRAYRRLQTIGWAMTLVWLAPLLWFFWAPAGDPRRSTIGALAVAMLMGAVVGSWLLRAAYDRLFARIAGQDGAYGF
jgi:hypothetical protein